MLEIRCVEKRIKLKIRSLKQKIYSWKEYVISCKVSHLHAPFLCLILWQWDRSNLSNGCPIRENWTWQKNWVRHTHKHYWLSAEASYCVSETSLGLLEHDFYITSEKLVKTMVVKWSQDKRLAWINAWSYDKTIMIEIYNLQFSIKNQFRKSFVR